MKHKSFAPLQVVLTAIGLLVFIFILTHIGNLVLLFPQGFIALKERNIIVAAMTIMLSVAIPVVIGMFFVAWKFRADNTKGRYDPEWTGNNWIKSSYWGLLIALVIIFFSFVWVAAHQLDPYKPLDSSIKPMTIQVVALQWKWLFIYPEQGIASVNDLMLPVHTPITFTLTADAPMSSFWIPSLGTQIYAMQSMETKLHVLSDKTGDFQGKTTEINGDGYAGMKFVAHVKTLSDFTSWVEEVKKTGKVLDAATFEELDKPSEDVAPIYFSSVDKNLYNSIITKYMKPKIQIEK